jgi:signal transduction histidine kinase
VGILPESISGRIVTLALAIALPLIGLLVWGFVEEANRQHAEAQALALGIARVVAGDIDDSHARARALLDRLAQRPGIQAPSPAGCDSLFAIVDFFPQYPNLLLYDLRGNALCSAKPGRPDAVYSAIAEAAIADAIRAGKATVDEPLVVQTRHRWILVSFQPVTAGGRTTGMLALLQYLDLGVLGYPPGTLITVSTLERRIVARSRDAEKWVGRTGTPTAASVAATKEREGRVASVGIDGVERQYGFRQLRTLPWRVFVGIPSAAAMAGVRSFLIHGLVIGAIILALVSILAFRITRTIQRPLAALRNAVKRAAQPGITELVPIEGPREVRELGTAFNEMMTKRSAAESAVLQFTAQLEALSQKLLDVQEEERTRIAREIHDELGQLLTALNMDIGGLLASVNLPPEQRTMGKRIRQALTETLSSVQRIAAELRPAILDDFGLVAAIELEGEKFEQRTGIECSLVTSPGLAPMSSETEASIFRIIQEAMTNVARHSNATRVEIQLTLQDSELVVEVRDDGRGISEAAIQDRSSLGLIGMRERARHLGGTVEVTRAAKNGTVVTLRVPSHTLAGAVNA